MISNLGEHTNLGIWLHKNFFPCSNDGHYSHFIIVIASRKSKIHQKDIHNAF